MNEKLVSKDVKRRVDVIHSIVMVVLSFDSMSLFNCKYTRKVKNDHAFNPVTTCYYIIVIHNLHLRFLCINANFTCT